MRLPMITLPSTLTTVDQQHRDSSIHIADTATHPEGVYDAQRSSLGSSPEF
ncbi:hypothetical protein NJB14192_44610 [Mycobacterium montefiorense]|nr:hypothetical protein NJB14192_44610 [Mycobacterium montefiorense]